MNSSLNNEFELKVRPCIDLIDSLRSLGVEKERDLALPAIAVIGDQSSGKSSVLEALSGVALPRGSGIVTRCPLELKMKRSREQGVWKGKISFQGHEKEIAHPEDVEKMIRDAQNQMAGTGLGIKDDLISLEVTSANVPDLTLIDLPGIARVAVKGQPDDIGDQIKKLIRMFIVKQETINLVVVPCNVDIATTEALKMAQEEDPEGERTLGILIKPDLVDKGTEGTVVEIVHNEVFNLNKGYMIVRCRGQKDILDSVSLSEATEKEETFFKDHHHFRWEKGNILHLKVTAFTQDALNLTIGEELKTAPQLKIFYRLREKFASWNQHLDFSGETFNMRIEKEVTEYEVKYRGRELPGFVNYKTFEVMVKDQIKKLEEPAIKKLKEISDFIKKSFIELAQSSFVGFPNLIRIAKSMIESIKQEKEAEAELMLRTQFKMELIVYTQDSIYSHSLSDLKQETQKKEDEKRNKSLNLYPLTFCYLPDNRATLRELMSHIKSYYKIASKRLADQVPLVIRYLLLQELAVQLQREMHKMPNDTKTTEQLLQEEHDIGNKRANLLSRKKRLTQARDQLAAF